MAITEYNYIPTYIKRTINNKPKDVVTASYWNELFNLLINQGDHTAEELGKVLNHFTAVINEVKGIADGKYVKPTDGIPKTDLAQDVQNSLSKADTALQEHQSLAAYRTAEAQDLIDNTKQDKLIAGENITIAADGKPISAINCSDKILSVTITGYTDAEIVADKTYAEIKAAIDSGYPIHTINKHGDIFVPRVNFESAVERITLAWTERLDSNTWAETVYEVNTQDSWGVTLREYVTPSEIGNLIALKTQAKDNLVVAINEVKQTTDAKQDKLIAGENITIAADGKTISATGGGVLPVTLTLYDPTQQGNRMGWHYTADQGRYEIKDAIDAGITVLKCSLIYEDNPNEVADVIYLNFSSMDSTAVFVGFDLPGKYYELRFPITSSIEGMFSYITLPTKTSELENDAGYLTLATLPKYEGGVE